MSTIWKPQRGGRIDLSVRVHDVTEEFGPCEVNPTLVIGAPDRVAYPADLPAGAVPSPSGRIKRVERLAIACPSCGAPPPHTAITTEHDLVVLGCLSCERYSWFRVPR